MAKECTISIEMGKFTSQNIAVIRKAANRPSIRSYFTSEMGESLKGIADWVMSVMEENIPFDTGNLHDGTGIGIYVDGILTAFRYQRAAETDRDGAWGYQKLNNAFASGSNAYHDGVWLVVFSTMPYAFKVDQWDGFFTEGFVEELKTLVTQEFKLR